MGACASVPKEMRDSAPEPLPNKEEALQADHQHNNNEEVVKVEKQENKADEVDESKQQSLSSLLDDQKESNEAQKPKLEAPAEPEPKKEEESHVEAQKEEPKAEAQKEETKAEAKEEVKEEEPKPDQATTAVPEEIKEQKEKKTETKETQ